MVCPECGTYLPIDAYTECSNCGAHLRVKVAVEAPAISAMPDKTDMITDDLSEKQQRILEYLREKAQTKSYFKSSSIGEDLDMSSKEVGSNMLAIKHGSFDVTLEKWAYSNSTTWKVTLENTTDY